MTTLVTEVGSLRQAHRIPSVVSDRIMRFLNDGRTGTVELNVKDGKIRAFKVIESCRVDDPASLDESLDAGQD